jgi:uncharacterized repeat protein (TIGR01451 family)
MANGGTFSVQITVTVATSNTILVNSTRASSNIGGGITISDTDTITHEAVASPEVSIAKRAVPPGAEEVGLNALVEPGDMITYTITVTNSGAGPVLDQLDIIDVLPLVPDYVTVDVITHSPALGYNWVGNIITFSNWFTFATTNTDFALLPVQDFDGAITGAWSGNIGTFPDQWQRGSDVITPAIPFFTSGANPNYAAVGSNPSVGVIANLVANVNATSCAGTPRVTLQTEFVEVSPANPVGVIQLDTTGTGNFTSPTTLDTYDFSGDGDGTNTYDLTGAAGNNVHVRFRYTANSQGGTNLDDYWAIDEIAFTCVNIPDTINTQINSIPGNSVVTATIKVTVVATDFVTLVNTAQLSTTAPIIGLDVSTVTHYVVPRPELQISKSAVPTPWSEDPTQFLDPDDFVTYTLIITNIGAGPAVNFQVTDTVPVSTTYDPASAQGSSSTGENVDSTDPGVGGLIRWEMVNTRTYGTGTYASVLPSGAVMTATFRVKASAVPTDTWVPNTAYGEAFGPVVIGGIAIGVSPVVTQSNTITHVIAVPVLQVSKTAVTDNEIGLINEVYPGDIITYTIAVNNIGNGTALDTEFVDTLPAIPGEVGYITSTPAGLLSGNILSWNLGSLASGNGVTATVVVSVTAQVSGTKIINTVAATATGDVANTYIFTATPAMTMHTVISKPVLLLTKLGTDPPSGSNVRAGDQITYTMIVTVTDAPVSGLVLTDIVPANTRYVISFLTGGMTCGTGQPQFTSPPASAGTPLIGTPASGCPALLPAGTVMSITFVVTTALVAQETVITNYFTVDVDQLLPRESNYVTHTIGGVSDGDIFLPIILRNFSPGPDLAVTSVEAGSNGVKVVVKNVGNSVASPRNGLSGYWVDFYLKPSPLPRKVNDTWDNGFANTGVAWLYTGPDLAPGDEVILTCTVPSSGVVCGGNPYVRYTFNGDTITNYGLAGNVAVSGDPIRGHADSACTPQCPDGLGSVVENHEAANGAYNSTTINNFGAGTATTTISIVSVSSDDPGDVDVSSFDSSNAPSRP